MRLSQEGEMNVFARKKGRQERPFHLLRRLRPQAPADHVHQVTAIAQWNGQQFGKVRQHYRVATELGAEGAVFQHLRGKVRDSETYVGILWSS